MKYHNSLDNEVDQLIDEPETYNIIVSKLALQGLVSNQPSFSSSEVKSLCLDLLELQGTIDGYGLLQAVEHCGSTSKTKTFIFLHQEYLAVYHIMSFFTTWPCRHVHFCTETTIRNFSPDGDNNTSRYSKYVCDQLQCFGLLLSWEWKHRNEQIHQRSSKTRRLIFLAKNH